MPPLLTSLAAVANRYDAAFCDIWGVIHNGRAVFPGVAEALIRFRAGGRRVVLVSNAPRPSVDVVPQLDQLGLPREAYDAVVTSGDVTRVHIAAVADRPIFHLGPERDLPLFRGIPVRLVSEADAVTCVCTGLFDDTTETDETYRPLCERLLARKVPMISANPDLVVERAGVLIFCGGAIAALYQSMGGEAIACGKPYRQIYDEAMAVLGRLAARPIAPERVLAIGDSVRTDISGAVAFGCGSLFIVGGIHAGEVVRDGRLDESAITAMFERGGASADAVMTGLTW